MDPHAFNKKKFWRRAALAAGAALALGIASVGVAAYKFFTERPGEEALRLVPASAAVAVTLDLSPSASQAAVFKKIDDALARNGMDREYNDLIAGIAAELNLDRDFAECLERGGAFAVFDLPRSKDEEPGIAFVVGLKNPARAEEILRNVGSKLQIGPQAAYKMEKGEALLAIVGPHLVLCPDQKSLEAVLRVAEGKAPSILTDAAFQKARDNLDADSNAMAFVNVRAFADLEVKDQKAKDMLDAFGWIGFGAALRDGGIAFKSGVDYDAQRAPALAKLAAIEPLDANLYARLPGGAYMVSAGSNGSAGLEFLREIVNGLDDKALDMRVIDRDIRKEIGMGVEDGILPAFRGHSVVALYPSGNGRGLDLLLVIDDANGADPAKLADAVRRTVSTKYSAATRKGPFMVALKGDGSRWQMAPEVEEEMRKAFDEDPPKEFDVRALMEDKTITYAKSGNAVLVATSKALLDRALNAYTTRNDSLLGDPSILPALNEAVPGAQSVTVVDLSRIAASVESLMRFDQMDPEAAKAAKGVIDVLKALTAPLQGSAAVGKTHIGGSFFLPLDYDRLIDFFADLVDEAKSKERPESR